MAARNQKACKVCGMTLEPGQPTYCPTCKKLVDAKKGIHESSHSTAKKKARKKLLKLQEKSQVKDPFDTLPVQMTFSEVELVLSFLNVCEPTHPLIKGLEQTQQLFLDDIARMHEIIARMHSNAWWDRPETWVNEEIDRERQSHTGKAKPASKRRRQQKEIAALPLEKIAEHLAACGVDLPSNVVEKAVDLRDSQSEHPGSPSPTVPGDEAEHLESGQVDGS